MKLKTIALALAASLSFASQADSSVGVSYSQFKMSDAANPSVLIASYEAPINESFDWEVRLGTGLSGDDLMGFETSVNYVAGAYAHYNFLHQESFKPYALVGYTTASLNVEGSMSFFGQTFSIDEDESESSLSFGVGFDYEFSNTSALNVEYAQYFSDTAGISIGYKYSF